MKFYRAGKMAFKAGKFVWQNPEVRAKAVSTGKKAWRHPAVQAKTSSLLGRLRGKSGSKPDKNQTKLF